ncbi:MAG: agmatine deiminase family protein [Gammaproteobacteria bacterium]|nr:agmatine deiminase family protein [Gammaproteobacteria bacterium]
MSVTVAGRLPAEWEPQSAIMLTWPRQDGDFARAGSDCLQSAEICLASIAAIISLQQSVLLVIEDDSMAARLRTMIDDAAGDPDRLIFKQAPADDIWARDHGPVSVISDGRPLLLNFLFDGWGKRFPADRDNAINKVVHSAGGFADAKMLDLDRVLEGGAIESDGEGTLICTRRWLERCCPAPQSLTCYISFITQLFDIKTFIILENGEIQGDDTSGHVDMLVRFANAETLLYQSCEQPADPHFPGLQALAVELRKLRRPNGQPFVIHPLPFPGKITGTRGNRLPASYANFLLTNKQVLVPGFGSPADQEALEIISGCFPGRQAVSIDSLPLITQGGGLHCATMHLPAGLLNRPENP